MVLVGLGSNLGDSQALVRQAMTNLKAFALTDYRQSSLWQTSPVDCPPGSTDYVNAIVAFQPWHALSPRGLLTALKSMEQQAGRATASERNAPRELDLDLLLFGDEVIHESDFILPHPRAVNRRFVLEPAAEVAPDLVWTGTERTLSELLGELDSAEVVTRMAVISC